MSEQEQKNSGGAASGRKKWLIVILAALVLLAGVRLVIRHNQNVQFSTQQAIKKLFDEDKSILNQSNYDTWLRYFNQVRNKKAFREALAEEFESHLMTCWEEDHLKKILTALGRAEYEDENIRDMVRERFAQTKELILLKIDASKPSSIFDAGRSMNYSAKDIQSINKSVSEFYQITDLYTEAEIRDVFVQAAEAYRDAGDLNHLADVLCTPVEFREDGSGEEDDYTAAVAYLDTQEIVDLYVGPVESVYTILPGIGGYYDSHRAPPFSVSDSADYHYGDFFYESHKKGGKTYDMTEFRKDPNLWNSIGKDMQTYILQSNAEANSSVITCYFRTQNIRSNKPQISALYEAGFEYAVPSKDGKSYIFISPFAICLEGNAKKLVFGDFSEQYELLKNVYNGGPAAAAPSESVLASSTPLSQQENPDASLAVFAPYCGIFEGEGSFFSDFYLINGNVFWTAAPVEEGGELPFIASEGGEPVSLYNGACQVKNNTVVLSGADSIGNKYVMQVAFDNNYISVVSLMWAPGSSAYQTFAEKGFNKAS